MDEPTRPRDYQPGDTLANHLAFHEWTAAALDVPFTDDVTGAMNVEHQRHHIRIAAALGALGFTDPDPGIGYAAAAGHGERHNWELACIDIMAQLQGGG